jgi:DNA-directed RNA polymerase specialized sigma24 family protein
MSHFDDFFRSHYRGMVAYCARFEFKEADVEEVVADVMYRHYDDYMEKLKDEPNPAMAMRRWMNRRALLDLRTMMLRHENCRTQPLHTEEDVVTGAAAVSHEQLHFDEPSAILDVKQRLPEVPAILVDYEQYEGGRGAGGATTTMRAAFSRARKKFMTQLAAH